MKKIIQILMLLTVCVQFTVAQTNSDDIVNALVEGQEAFANRSYSVALTKFTFVENEIGGNEKLFYYKTLCYYYLKEYIDAKKYLDKYLATDPSGGFYDKILGMVDNINTNYENAINEKKDYDYAITASNVVVKIKFIEDYPDSKYKTEITNQLDELLWDKVEPKRKTFDIQNYLKYVPYGEHSNIAKEILAFRNAMKENSIDDFEQFKEDYPYADSITIVDNKLKDAYLYYADKFLKEGDENAAIRYCNYYLKLYSTGSRAYKIKEIKQEAYYNIGEDYRLNNSKEYAIDNYNKCIAIKSSGVFYNNSEKRIEEYRIAELTAEKNKYYNRAMDYKSKANTYFFKGLLNTTIGLCLITGGGLLLASGYGETLPEVGGAVLIGAGCYFILFPGGNYGKSSSYRQDYREEMRKYNNVQVSLSPAYYPTQNNAVGLAINIKF